MIKPGRLTHILVTLSFIGSCVLTAIPTSAGPMPVVAPLGSSAEVPAACSFTIPSNTAVIDGRVSPYDQIQPGDTVCLAAGSRAGLSIRNVHGGSGHPVKFVNYGGQVAVQASGHIGIFVQNSRYLQIAGDGVSSIPYGIIILSGSHGVLAGNKTSDITIDHIEITGTEHQGITVKTEATCPDGSNVDYDYDGDGNRIGDLDDVVNRGNFTQYNTWVHDNYIHDVGGEALYIGSSFFRGDTSSCAGETIYPPLLNGVEIDNNLIQDVGWDGIGSGSIVEDCKIHHNQVYRTGKAKRDFQNAGLDCKSPTICDVFSNFVRDAGGPGIQFDGGSNSKIFNNVIINAGLNMSLGNNTGDGITVWGGLPTMDNGNIYLWQNTIINPRNFGVKFSYAKGTGNRIQNNIIVNPGNYSGWGDEAYVKLYSSAPVAISHNVAQLDATGLNFANPAADDYALGIGSKAIDSGTDLFALGVVEDYSGIGRPQGAGFDIGAFEYVDPNSVFADVPTTHPYHDEIEALYQAGYTAGCRTDPLMYCPDATMNRAESAVFVQHGIHDTGTLPPQPTSQTFADLPLDSWAAKWAEALWQDHYTAGCGTNPLVYCPWQGHTRAEGCVFYLHMLNGPTYAPPQPSQQTFADVPLEAWYAKWVQAAYDAGLITACQTSPELRFCPNDPLSRGLAAYMMVQAKHLSVLPPAGLYHTCWPGNQSCLDELRVMHDGGFAYTINYSDFDYDIDTILAYANKLESLGMKTFWDMSRPTFAQGSVDPQYVIDRVNAVKGSSATAGYYVGDESNTTPTDVEWISSIVRQADPNPVHRTLFVHYYQIPDCTVMARAYSSPSVDALGLDLYAFANDRPSEDVSLCSKAGQEWDDAHDKDWVAVLQSFRGTDYGLSNDFPSRERMRLERDLALQNSRPLVIFWWWYRSAQETGHWDDLVWAANGG